MLSASVFLAEVDVGLGALTHLRCSSAGVVAIDPALRPHAGEPVVDCAGGRVLHGLHDHHLHLLSSAARTSSLDLGQLPSSASDTLATVLSRLVAHAATLAPGAWVRAVGFDERRAGWLDLAQLDLVMPDRPARVQHRSGHAWLANTAALQALSTTGGVRTNPARHSDLPPGWVLDDATDWGPQARAPLDLAGVGRSLSDAGITGVTDATPQVGAAGLLAIDQARCNGLLPQHVTMMCDSPELPPSVLRGPVKVLLPADTELAAATLGRSLAAARSRGLPVAVHCVTAEQLILTLAALDIAGLKSGDRIEHASVAPYALLPELARRGLTVVTQPAFVFDRGDAYLADHELDPRELYRLRSLLDAGVALLAGSDAPFGRADPWHAMRSAVMRRTASRALLGPREALDVGQALRLFSRPGTTSRALVAPDSVVRVGDRADLCVLQTRWPVAVDELDQSLVGTTIIQGRVIHQGGRAA